MTRLSFGFCFKRFPKAWLASMLTMKFVFLGSYFCADGAFALPEKNPDSFPQELVPLVQVLRKAGYKVVYSKPPIHGAFGATDTRKKVIWLDPVSSKLGLARQTLIHEAVHAAQGCPNGRLELIGWQYSLPIAVDREIAGLVYRNYPRSMYAVEKEAFMMQSHPSAHSLIAKALLGRC